MNNIKIRNNMIISLTKNLFIKKKKANNKPLELTEVKMGGAIAQHLK
jgi:hypothetical protein